MNHLRAALPFVLTLFLAACGGGGTTPTPPTEQPPDETPPIVQPPVEQPPADGAPVINIFSANPATISAGESVTLAWDVTNAEIIRLEPDPGQGDLSSLTSVTVAPTATTTYTLEAVSLNGLDDTASVTVTVEGSTQPPPTSDVPYYGEWIVTYTSDTGVSFIHSLNITEPAPPSGWQDGGYGLDTLCLDQVTPCRGELDDSASGFGYIGNFELDDGTAPLDLSIFTQYNPEDEADLKIFTVGGLSLESDAQGRQTLEGSAVWSLSDGNFDEGTIYAVNIGAPRFLAQSSSVSASLYTDKARQLREQTQASFQAE